MHITHLAGRTAKAYPVADMLSSPRGDCRHLPAPSPEGTALDGHWIEARRDFGNGPAPPRIAPQGVPRDVEKGLRKCVGNDWVRLASRLQCTWALRERFDQGHAERPHVRGRGERSSSGFRSVVRIELAG